MSSTSPPVRYRELPCDFFCFFFSDRLANGSIRSTKVPEDILDFGFATDCTQFNLIRIHRICAVQSTRVDQSICGTLDNFNLFTSHFTFHGLGEFLGHQHHIYAELLLEPSPCVKSLFYVFFLRNAFLMSLIYSHN